jgi:hypothetical protein
MMLIHHLLACGHCAALQLWMKVADDLLRLAYVCPDDARAALRKCNVVQVPTVQQQ